MKKILNKKVIVLVGMFVGGIVRQHAQPLLHNPVEQERQELLDVIRNRCQEFVKKMHESAFELGRDFYEILELIQKTRNLYAKKGWNFAPVAAIFAEELTSLLQQDEQSPFSENKANRVRSHNDHKGSWVPVGTPSFLQNFPYPCKYCGQQFGQPSHRKSHINRSHPA